MFISTLVGEIGVCEEDGFITNLFFGGAVKPQSFELSETPLLNLALEQIKEFFLGKRTKFDLPIRPLGTPFQLKVWEELMAIPYGQTKSYKEIAESLGEKNCFRAVGLACSKNPILLIIPCHRVIAENGKLSGFAGGINAKQKLLSLEKGNKK